MPMLSMWILVIILITGNVVGMPACTHQSRGLIVHVLVKSVEICAFTVDRYLYLGQDNFSIITVTKRFQWSFNVGVKIC